MRRRMILRPALLLLTAAALIAVSLLLLLRPAYPYSLLGYPALPIDGLKPRSVAAILDSGEEAKLVKLTSTGTEEWYGYKGKNEDKSKGKGSETSDSEALISHMKKQGWTYKEQNGAGYFFHNEEGGSRIVTSQQWTSRYVLYKVHPPS
ncbi:hypothetical protein ACFO9Q_03705 [Paenibacillus sp. GCM10023252]|uniref:hypothetical protein n=1 Tax=Paenibacillus sp. GCM10023252 TaxID=3252649 RepID=UPI00360E1D59